MKLVVMTPRVEELNHRWLVGSGSEINQEAELQKMLARLEKNKTKCGILLKKEVNQFGSDRKGEEVVFIFEKNFHCIPDDRKDWYREKLKNLSEDKLEEILRKINREKCRNSNIYLDSTLTDLEKELQEQWKKDEKAMKWRYIKWWCQVLLFLFVGLIGYVAAETYQNKDGNESVPGNTESPQDEKSGLGAKWRQGIVSGIEKIGQGIVSGGEKIGQAIRVLDDEKAKKAEELKKKKDSRIKELWDSKFFVRRGEGAPLTDEQIWEAWKLANQRLGREEPGDEKLVEYELPSEKDGVCVLTYNSNLQNDWSPLRGIEPREFHACAQLYKESNSEETAKGKWKEYFDNSGILTLEDGTEVTCKFFMERKDDEIADVRLWNKMEEEFKSLESLKDVDWEHNEQFEDKKQYMDKYDDWKNDWEKSFADLYEKHRAASRK